jgi:AbrB family looped-hinge helix DNA binding protein
MLRARRTSLRIFGWALQETWLASIENLCNISAIDMATVTISPKFQVVIPKDVRDGLALSPGDKVEVIQLEGRIEIVPVKPIESLRGFLKGLTNTFEREGDRCLS